MVIYICNLSSILFRKASQPKKSFNIILVELQANSVSKANKKVEAIPIQRVKLAFIGVVDESLKIMGTSWW
jgi:hypothetical protein